MPKLINGGILIRAWGWIKFLKINKRPPLYKAPESNCAKLSSTWILKIKNDHSLNCTILQLVNNSFFAGEFTNKKMKLSIFLYVDAFSTTEKLLVEAHSN